MTNLTPAKPAMHRCAPALMAEWLSVLAARWIASEFSVRYFFAGATLLYFIGMGHVAPGLLDLPAVIAAILLYVAVIMTLHVYSRFVPGARVDRLFYLVEAPVLGVLIAQDPVPAMPLQLLLVVDLLDHGLRFGLRRLVLAAAGLALAAVFALAMRALTSPSGIDPSALWVLFIILACTVYLLSLVGTRDAAERRAREAQERITSTIAATGIGIWTDDLRERRLHWDANSQRLAGLAGKAFGGSYEEFTRLLPKTDVEHYLRAREAAIRNRTPLNTEYRVVWADGSEHTIGTSATTVYDDEGRPLRMLGASWDNTHLHRENDSLANLSRRLTLAQAAAGVGFWTFDLMNRCVSMDENCLRIFGLGSMEQFGGNADDLVRLIHPDDRERVAQLLGKVVDSETDYRVEYRVVRPGGEERSVRTVGIVVRATGSSAARTVIGATVDITREIRDQAQLRGATERLKSMGELMRIGRWEYDPIHDRFEPDPNFEALLGMEPGTVGKTLEEVLLHVRDEQRTGLRTLIDELMARGSEISMEYDAVFPGGRAARLLVRGQIDRDAQGCAVRARGGVMDISRLHAAVRSADGAGVH